MSYAPDLWAAVVLAVALAVAALTDVWKGKVLNAVTYPAIVIGLAVQTSVHGVDGLLVSAGGFAAGFCPMWICWYAGGIGGGDAKLMGAVGALTNWEFAIAAMVFAFAIAALMAVVVMIHKRIVLRTGRRIFRAVWLALIPAAKGGWPEEAGSPKIPFGVAVCLGAAAALADSLCGGPISAALLGA